MEGKYAEKTKYDGLTTEKYNDILVQIVINHLEKVKGWQEVRPYLENAQTVYHNLKKARAYNKEIREKLTERGHDFKRN